jgi:branched-chain amino acid transport system permease protein
MKPATKESPDMNSITFPAKAQPDAARRPLLNRNVVLGALAGVALLVLPHFIDSPSHQNLLILILMAAQLGVAWNILGGFAGQVSLGHVAFFGIGAYTSTMLLMNFGINPWIGALVGGVVSVAVGTVIGWPCFRLKGHYFTMATIAVAELIQILFNNWDFAGSAVGLTIPMDKQGIGMMIFASKVPYYYLALGLLAISLGVNFWISKSFLGYYFRAIKDEPDAARSLGVSLTKYKLVALGFSTFLAALGGSLYAQKELYIDPNSVLHTGLSIKMALVSILGGVGSLFGPVVGATAFTLIEEGSRILFGGTGRGTDMIVQAVIIIAIAVYKPSGLLGWGKELWARFARRSGKGDAA